MTCSKCNSQIPDGSSVCPYCGGMQATIGGTEIQEFDSRDTQQMPMVDYSAIYSQPFSEPIPKSNRKAILILIVSLLLLAALILTGFLLYREGVFDSWFASSSRSNDDERDRVHYETTVTDATNYYDANTDVYTTDAPETSAPTTRPRVTTTRAIGGGEGYIVTRIGDPDSISAGAFHTVALKADGTVVATGHNGYGQCDVTGWSNIAAVSAGAFHTVALKADGTVVATGWNSSGQCDVSDWRNIVAIATGDNFTIGLTDSHTVVAVGDNSSGQCNVTSWSDVFGIAAGGAHTVALTDTGVVATGDNSSGQCNVSSWNVEDIWAVSAGADFTVALKTNGTVTATGSNTHGQCGVIGWTNIVAISAGKYYTVGVKANGTVVATSYTDDEATAYDDYSGQCVVSSWADVVAVSAGDGHTVALMSNGTVVSTQYSAPGNPLRDEGRSNVAAWSGVAQPGSRRRHTAGG